MQSGPAHAVVSAEVEGETGGAWPELNFGLETIMILILKLEETGSWKPSYRDTEPRGLNFMQV